MFKAVAYYSNDQGSWHIIFGKYDTMQDAEKACYEYGRKHEDDTDLKYFQIMDK